MNCGFSGSIWYLEGKSNFSSCTSIAQFTEALQIVCSWKAGDWIGGTNPDSGKHSLTHSLSLKEVGLHNKGMAVMPLSSSSYLWHLIGSWEIYFGIVHYIQYWYHTRSWFYWNKKEGLGWQQGVGGDTRPFCWTTWILPCRPLQPWTQPLYSQIWRWTQTSSMIAWKLLTKLTLAGWIY